MSELAPNGRSSYTDEQRREAAVLYAHKGLLTKVEAITGIPDSTLSEWKNSEWWDEIVGTVRNENKERDIARYDRIVNKASKLVLEKLPDASARDCMIIAATAQDKGRILQSLPNSYQGDGESIKSLKAQFEALSTRHKAIEDSVVSDQ